jgi:hypothetical protein
MNENDEQDWGEDFYYEQSDDAPKIGEVRYFENDGYFEFTEEGVWMSC